MKQTMHKTSKGNPVIRVGKWYVEWRNGGIYAYAIDGPASGVGHQIPAELVDGKPYYPFGIYHTVPQYAIKAMDSLVKEYGATS
jgi:hypothetical protein